MYSEYKKAKNKKEKAEIIKKYIQKTNPEYNRRTKEEQEYYKMLKEKIKNENKSN
jgi:arginyl-tRNA--protein-N-Asp/Glu arginylyltransferase